MFAAYTLKNFLLVFDTSSFNKKDFLVPGVPYNNIPFHGCLFPWNN